MKPRCPAAASADAEADEEEDDDADKWAERNAGDLSGVCGGMRATGVVPASRSRFLRSIELPLEKAPWVGGDDVSEKHKAEGVHGTSQNKYAIDTSK